jgi:uncharacterized membrane protein YdjX (TVP38/TMEM64 family)
MPEMFSKIQNVQFWIDVLQNIKELGILLPISLTFIEALVPALPLTAIVAFNVGLYGIARGFVYSWLGSVLGAAAVFLFFRHVVRRRLIRWMANKKVILRVQAWISRQTEVTLFLLIAMPFTPSALINISFGLSDFNQTRFIRAFFLGKLVMIGLLSALGNVLTEAFEKPLFILLAVLILIGLLVLTNYIEKRTGFRRASEKSD